jgi:heme-degrading monooxygenase HmoA
MPHKYNADRRHHIPRARYKVTNWRDYEAGLRQRGSLTIWFSEEAVAAWRAAPRTTPGGQARYSESSRNRGATQAAAANGAG